VDDPRLREQLEQLLDLYLKDTSAWHMASDGKFSQRQGDGEELLVQQQLLSRWRGRLSAVPS
jgi:polyphosphate kinase